VDSGNHYWAADTAGDYGPDRQEILWLVSYQS